MVRKGNVLMRQVVTMDFTKKIFELVEHSNVKGADKLLKDKTNEITDGKELDVDATVTIAKELFTYVTNESSNPELVASAKKLRETIADFEVNKRSILSFELTSDEGHNLFESHKNLIHSRIPQEIIKQAKTPEFTSSLLNYIYKIDFNIPNVNINFNTSIICCHVIGQQPNRNLKLMPDSCLETVYHPCLHAFCVAFLERQKFRIRGHLEGRIAVPIN
jgi:hypothetical protein